MSTNDSRIKNWSTTPATNGIGSTPYFWPEGQAPSTVNDCARQMMADLRYQWEDAAWFQWGDTVSRASATTFKIAANVTSRYTTGRRLKVFDAATYYATVVTSSYSAPDTTITVSMDSGSLTASLSAVALSILEPTNSPIPETSTANDNYPCLGRLTLESGVPVSVTDQTAKTTLYFTPMNGNTISLYDGTSTWEMLQFSELSIAVPATTNTLYDVYVYNNSGTPALELAAWGSDTTRSAIALTMVSGVYLKNGATTRRYVGNMRTTGSSGQTEDSQAKRYVWNYYNRVLKPLLITDATSSWTYSTGSWRQARATATNQFEFIIGIVEDIVDFLAMANTQTVTASVNMATGIGIDATNSATSIFHGTSNDAGTTSKQHVAIYRGFVAKGYHYAAWLEYGGGSGTQTWIGTATSPRLCGLIGSIRG